MRVGIVWQARALSVEAPPRGVSWREHVLQVDRRLPGNENVQEKTQQEWSAWRASMKDDGGLEALSLGTHLLDM